MSSRHLHLFLLAGAGAAAAVLLLLLALYLYFHIRRSPEMEVDDSSLRRFSRGELRSAAALQLGCGASGAVHLAVLSDGRSVAVKSAVGEVNAGELLNELRVLAAIPPSPFVVSLVGFSNSGRRRRLVFEHMSNGSLQSALFGPRAAAELGWRRRFAVLLDVSQALEFLHLVCDPPVIHGDVKPSNVLLGPDFRAKLADFGLSRFKPDISIDLPIELFSQELSGPLENANTNRSASPKGKEAATVAPFEDENLNPNPNPQWGKDWWWKQGGSGELCSRDYVREWIGSQIYTSRNGNWDDETKLSPESCFEFANSNRLSLEETISGELNSDPTNKRKPESQPVNRNRKMREWWKEEYFAEISSKSRKKRRKGLNWFQSTKDNSSSGKNNNNNFEIRNGWRKNRRNRSVGSDMWSGDLFSKELSSTRGTVCYVAPEHKNSTEKADVYSFGVLILVLVSGRRPLHVLSSPMKLERANLVSWARQLVHKGNVLELVDERLKDCYDKEQACLCVNLALLCLQRAPELRPDSGEIVKILRGEMELPVVPFQFSPSPNSKLSRRRATLVDSEFGKKNIIF